VDAVSDTLQGSVATGQSVLGYLTVISLPSDAVGWAAGRASGL